MSLMPLLLQRLCAAPQVRAQLLSLSSFNPAVSFPVLPVGQRRWYARSSSGRRVGGSSVAVRARRNVFLDPKEKDTSSFAGLYDSSRFNDDDDLLPQQQPQVEGGAAGAAAAALVAAEDDGEFEDEGAEGSSGGAAPAFRGVMGAAELPPAKHTKVKTAEFVKSSVSVKDCPKAGYPEFAVIGRSNVGKSSLINLLTGRKSLAMVSKTPGKTRCINHFVINNNWYLVDLPGYGYAKTSKENVLGWNKFTREYFVERDTLVSVLLLVDASIPPMPLDVACADWFGDAQIPYTIVFTKTDKRKKGCPPVAENIAAFQQELLKNWEELPPMLATSSRAGSGRGELLAHISQLREAFKRAGRV